MVKHVLKKTVRNPKLGIVAFGNLLILFALGFRKNLYTAVPLLAYGLVLLVAGFKYWKNRKWFWTAIVLMAPWAVLIYFQFIRRIYFWFVHGGEGPNGIGSPMAFIIRAIMELPFIIFITIIMYTCYKDSLRSNHKVPIKQQ